MRDLSEVVWQLLLSEIPFTIDGITSRHLHVSLGTPHRESLARTSCLTPDEAAAFLIMATVQHFPDSVFSRWATITRNKQYCPTDSDAALD
jgi:hypothetical protein